MGFQSFIIFLLVCGSFFYAAASIDVEALQETLDDIQEETEDLGIKVATNTEDNNHILRELEDMTDMLEETTTNDEELPATDNRRHDATDWEDGTMLDAQAMLADLDAVAEDVQQDQHQIIYNKLGCYQDNLVDPRPLPELLADLTGEVDWYQLDKVFQKCAKFAYDKGYTHFGMQSFGQCRSGKNASSTYNRDGIASGGCRSGLGGHGENLVFMVVSLQLTTPLPTAKPTTIPSECQNYVTLNSINRSMNFNKSVSSCDDKLPRGWYRFEGPAGNKMPTSCVPTRHCGGHAPGWLTGAHPAVHEGKVRREVCFHWKSCCSWRNSVLVRNCGAFYVYDLSPPLTCNLRYCGDGQLQETTTTSPTTTPAATTETRTTAPETTTTSPATTPTPVPTTETTTTAPETTTVTSTTKKSTPPVPSTLPSIPPECVNYSNLDSADRSMHFIVSKHLGKCDNSLQMGWYRFQGDAGDHIPTSCVVKEHCGTHAPGWLSGTHPTVSQGALRAKVCFHWVDDCCKWSTYIRVRNCSGFYVYELHKPPFCRLRYCGNGVQAPTTSPTLPPTSSSTHRSTASSTQSHTTTSPTSPTTPPECLNYKLLKETNRALGFSTKNQSAACDSALSSDWYRFSGEAGDKMPDFCVAKLRCGTHAPGWLNTTHPSMADGIVKATVCFHWGPNCCYWSTEIRVRNCGEFFVYELHRTTHCSLRYCGNNRQVPTLTTVTTSAPTTLTFVYECAEYKELSEEGRSQNYKYRSVQGAKPTCDRSLPKAWYRFSGMAGNRMADKCVPTYRCGTLAPGWLQGGHPSVRDGLVSRTVCFNWGQKCCRWSRQILVRNCGDFYVYNLQKAPVCKLRYCGVGQIAQTTMPKPTTTPKPTTASPFPTEPNYGFVVVCLPFGMHVRVSRKRLPSFVNPSLLSLDDPRCGVVKMDDNDVMLATTLDSCGTMRRTEDDRISFHNKIVAESGMGNKRSSFEFPFRCTYKKFSSVGQVNKFEPLYKRGEVMDSTLDYE